MPRKYTKKTNRSQIPEERMKLAIKAVICENISKYKAAERYGVKRTTIQSRIKKLLKTKTLDDLKRHLEDSGNESEEDGTFNNKYTSQQIFNVRQEELLSIYIKRCSDLNYGLTYKQIRILAYDYVKSIENCKIPKNWETDKMAGVDWLYGFMQRHRDLSLRKPEGTSLSRSMAFNQSVVDDFFKKYISVVEKYHFTAEQIYNLDETGLTTVSPPVKVVSTKGKKQVGQIASQERGELVTFVGIINAAGSAVPPVFVYPRIRNPEEYLGDIYPNSAVAFGNKKGWMTADIFPKVIQHFIRHVKPSPENKVLLLLDNHESHISVETIKLCKENGIVLLSFPPHTTHRMQPLDVGIFGPFKSYFSVAQNDWLLSHPGRAITIRHISLLASKAYSNAFTIKNITSSFKATGLWPVDRLVFSDADFLPSVVTDKPLNSEREENNMINVEETQSTSIQERSKIPQIKTPESTISAHRHTNAEITPPSPKPSTSKCPNVEDIRPYPKSEIKAKKTNKNRKSKSTIYTDTPEFIARQNLEMERKRKKSLKENRAVKRSLESENIRRRESTSSESSIDVILANSSDDEDSFSEEITYLSPEDNVSVNDFVLIKFSVKRNSDTVYYVGKILSIKNQEYEVKFLRRKGVSNSFVFPVVDDISVIERNDLAAILHCPEQKGTARTASVLKFNVNFSTLNVR